jgi:F-box-like
MDIQELPEEILARIFEEGVHQLGAIDFLHPMCLVCKRWNSIASSTPRLWGIIDAGKGWSALRIRRHLSRCKSAPLTVSIEPKWEVPMRRKYEGRRNVVTELIGQSDKWISAKVPSDTFTRRRWPEDYPNLQILTLIGREGSLLPPTFERSEERADRIHELELLFLHPAWIEPFLYPSLRSLKYKMDPLWRRENPVAISTTLDQLSKVPNIQELELTDMCHFPSPSEIFRAQARSCVHLPQLQHLHLTKLMFPTLLLGTHAIRAPSLTSLSIKGFDGMNSSLMEPTLGLGAIFFEWCTDRGAQFMPTHLHTLELEDCLGPDEIPDLVRLLARLPELVRLSVRGIEAPRYSAESLDSLMGPTNTHMVLDGLSKPLVGNSGSAVGGQEGGSWLCPSLILLDLSARDVQIQDFLQLARARGVRSEEDTAAPKSLRTLRVPLCSDGPPETLAELKTLVDSVECECMSCAVNDSGLC